MSYEDRHLWSSGVLTLEAASTLEQTFCPLNRVQIHKIGLKSTSSAAGGASVAFQRRRLISTDVTIETVVIPAADSDGKLYYTEVFTPIVFLPGDQLSLVVTEAGTAPTAIALLEYSILDVDLDEVNRLANLPSAPNADPPTFTLVVESA